MKMPPKELSVKPSYNSHSMVDVVVYSLNPKDLDSIVEIANNRVNNIPKSPISRETRKPVAPIIADHEFELSSMNIQELSPSANVAPYTDDMEGGEPSKLKDPGIQSNSKI